jgi:hypothetical protein
MPDQGQGADENQRLIEGCSMTLSHFNQMDSLTRCFGCRRVSFVHVVIEHEVASADSLAEMAALQTFVAVIAGIADRCEEQPVPMGATVIGGYR